MSDEYNALKFIATSAGIHISQLPPLQPSDFSASDWRAVLYYANGTEVRECLMWVYQRAGVSVVCPNCNRYAGNVFFQRGRQLPTVFRCEYENLVWHDKTANEDLVSKVVKRYNASLVRTV